MNAHGHHVGRRVSAGTAEVLRTAFTIACAIAIGAGVPLLWIWIGSKIQDSIGPATEVEDTTAAAMMLGIVLTYVLILVLGTWLQSLFVDGDDAKPARSPWNRSLSDEPYRPGTARLSMLERVFVTTAVVVSIALLIWFFGFAGSPLPGQ